MNDHDDPHHRSPPRAEPIQPDRPGRGTDKQDGTNSTSKAGTNTGQEAARSHAEELRKQSEVAVENTREGYGGR